MSKRSGILVIFVLFVLLTQYQNCAMTSPNDGASNVKIVQDLATQKVAFVESQVTAMDSADSVPINGLCVQTSSGQLAWTLHNQVGQTVQSGQTKCVNGSFELLLTGLSKQACGNALQLQVGSSDSGAGSLQVTRKCSPVLAQQQVSANEGRDQCFLELISQNPVDCAQVCYHGAIVTLFRHLNAQDCQTLQP